MKITGRKLKRGRKDQYAIGFRQKVAKEYIHGDQSYAQVGIRYGIDRTTVHYWVKRYYPELRFGEQKPVDMTEGEQKELEALRKQNEDLKKKLEYSEMKAHAWEIMVDIAEKQLGIDIKKKSGTKQP